MSYAFHEFAAQRARRSRRVSRLIDVIAFERARWVVDHLGLDPGVETKVLDVGCGTGHISECLSARGHDVSSCDRFDLRTTVVRSLPFQKLVCDRLPYSDGQFDAVVLVFVLHHVPAAQHQRLLDECARVTRGAVVIFEDVFEGSWERFRTMINDRLLNLDFGAHPHANRSESEWVRELESRGLTVATRSFATRHVGMAMRHAILVGRV